MRSNRERPLIGTPGYFATIHESNRRLLRAVKKRAEKAECSLAAALWREARIVGKAAAGMTLLVWTVRVMSQLLDVRWLNESILAGHWNNEILDIENRIDVADRKKGG